MLTYDFDEFADWCLSLIKQQPCRYDRGDSPATGSVSTEVVVPASYAAGSASAP
jgi:hypothetical protein